MQASSGKTPKIVLVGGGSVKWTPRILNDFSLTPGLDGATYVILDLNPTAGEAMVKYGERLFQSRGLRSGIHFTASQQEAFQDADFVLITISTGGFASMEADLLIPEDYGIFQTVGDTVGPGGWARGLRNMNVMADMARTIERYAPRAIVLNYSNPMATLTQVFHEVSRLRTVGLCHGLYEVYDLLMKLFDLEREEELTVRMGGTNHFFWITELSIRGQDGYALLRERMNGRSFADLCAVHQPVDAGDASHTSNVLVCSELFDHYGYLPYVTDTHTAEFFPRYLTGPAGAGAPGAPGLAAYDLRRKTISTRQRGVEKAQARLRAYISGEKALPEKRSREAAADIVAAMFHGGRYMDVMNLPNTGQIQNLPLGAVVETIGVADALGFAPLHVGKLPEPLAELIVPHANNQRRIVEAGLAGDTELALFALYNDPLCAHLTYPQVKEMGQRLLHAHKAYLPQFNL